MAEVETVALNLGGNFAGEAEKAADGADRLGKSFEKLGGSASKVQPPKLVSEEQRLKMIQRDADDAARALQRMVSELERAISRSNRLKDSLSANRFDQAMKVFLGNAKTPEALTPKLTAKYDFGKNALGGVFEAVNKAFGDKASNALRNGAVKLVEGGEKLAPIAPALLSAGSVLVSAAGALTIATGGLLAAGYKLSVEQSSKKEIQSAILGKLGGDYGVVLDIAAKFNLDEDEVLRSTKMLLDAKFKGQELIDWERILAGASLVRGEEKARALLEKLATQAKKGGKATEESVKGFAEAGVDVDKVWAKLAQKLGTSVDQAKAKVKSGAVDMKDALDAVKQAAGDDFGGIADKIGGSVPGLINAIRIQLTGLFADVDLSPLKDFLGNVLDVLKGDAGGELKGAISDLFGNLGEAIFGNFKGEEGKAKLTKFVKDVAAGIKELSGVIKNLKPLFGLIEDGVLTLAAKAPGFIAKWAGVVEGLSDIISIASPVVDAILSVRSAIGELWDFILDPVDTMQKWLGNAGPSAKDGGNTIGQNLIDGLTDAITGGADGPIGAIVSVIQGVIDAAHSAADAHSPSRKMQKLGGWMTEGLAVGQAENDNASRAAADTVQGAMGAAADAAAGGEGARGGAGPGGGAVTIQIIIQGNAQISAEQLKAVENAAYEGYLRAKRREGREGREGSKAA